MKRIITSGILVGLSACSVTPQKIRSTEPEFSITSQHSAEEIAMCVSDKWENTSVLGGSPVINSRKTKMGHTVTMYIGGTISHLIDIKDTDQGQSIITAYSNVLAIGEDPSIKAVLDCQSQ